MVLGNYFDNYVVRARIAPCIVVALPFAIAVLPYYGSSYGWGFFSFLFVQVSVGFFLSQFCRDAGNKAQQLTFADQLPSVCFLRWRDSTYSVEKKAILHDFLATNTQIKEYVTEAYEKEHPEKADDVYSLWNDWLKENTRTGGRFSLIREENANYGFRRNLYGLKFIWKISTVVGWLLFFLRLVVSVGITPENITTFLILVGSAATLLRVDETWVRTAANTYAKQLHLAVHSLPPFPEKIDPDMRDTIDDNV